jgi:xylan 1,4-beta-xylosidase
MGPHRGIISPNRRNCQPGVSHPAPRAADPDRAARTGAAHAYASRIARRARTLLLIAAVAAAWAAAPAQAIEDPPSYQNPVYAGDFPDPSVVRIGPEYWAAGTASSRGFPPILRSPDLVHWTLAGSIFQEAPAWSDGQNYWAPELFRQGDTYLAYYSARRKSGKMCVAVASSLNPIGPYDDAGPLVCQPAGSIDPSVVRNSEGWPFLVWKEDRNTEGVTTVIWIQPLSRDGLALTGVRRKILSATGRGWEGGVVEGPQIIRRKHFLYLFYSGNLCCGPNCEYAMGVARSKGLYGPWQRLRRNPILDSDDDWLCPGHGSVVQSPNGRWWMLYGSYNAVGTISPGRLLLLDPISWTRDAWPVVNGGKGPSAGH